MTDAQPCPTCGAPLQADAPGGTCPKCLLAAGLATGGGAPVAADDLAAVAADFPGLVIEALVGRGGMGVVYRARHRALDRIVALKVLPETVAADAAFAERFQREARALAKLQHPNIVGVHDFGTTRGRPWLVMEYVDGANIRQAMAAGTIGPKEALAIVPQICDALQYAHEHGVVHRDIKPENVLLDRAGRVKVADFGLAKLMERGGADRTLTGASQVMGTPHYMAPEQWEKPTTVDHRADIYSLGVVFYEMLTGELPVGRFAAPSKRSDVDARIDEIVLRTLEREREARYQRVDEVKTDVGRVATSPAAAPCAAPAAAERRGEHAWLVAAGVVACAVAVVTLTSSRSSETTKAVAAIGGIVTGALLIGHVWSRRRHRVPGSPPRHWGWWVAAASLLLCGGPLALFGIVALTPAIQPIKLPQFDNAEERVRRQVGHGLDESGRSDTEAVAGGPRLTHEDRQEIDALWARLCAAHRTLGIDEAGAFYDPSAWAGLRPMLARERDGAGRLGTLGLPLSYDDFLGGPLESFELQEVRIGSDGRSATGVAKAGSVVIEFGLDHRGGWTFSTAPVRVRHTR